MSVQRNLICIEIEQNLFYLYEAPYLELEFSLLLPALIHPQDSACVDTILFQYWGRDKQEHIGGDQSITWQCAASGDWYISF